MGENRRSISLPLDRNVTYGCLRCQRPKIVSMQYTRVFIQDSVSCNTCRIVGLDSEL
jgi:transcription elongation factor Elf1